MCLYNSMIKFESVNPFLQLPKSYMVFKKNQKRKRRRLSSITVTIVLFIIVCIYYHNFVLLSNQERSLVILESDDTHYETGSFANCIPRSGNNSDLKRDQTSFSIAKYENDETSSSSSSETHTGTIQVSCHPIQYIISLNQFVMNNIDISIIVGVLSSNSIDGKKKRDSIRQTWANQDFKQKRHAVFFLVAGSWNEIKNEFNQHYDILWIDEEEKYNGEQSVLTFKTYSFIKIMDIISKEKQISFSHLFKTDDDSYVNLNALQKEIDTNPNDYIGHCQDEMKVVRDASCKWPLTYKTYPEEYFPKYCQGAGYVLSRNFVHCSSSFAHIGQVRFMPFEDAAVGILAERCGISPSLTMTGEIRHSRYGSKEAHRRTKEGDKNTDGLVPIAACMTERILQHRVINEIDMEELHKTVVDPEYCKITRRKRREIIDGYESRGIKWYG